MTAHKTIYKTKQGEELLTYLKQHQGKHITVNEISAYFTSVGKPIGTATIYRHLDRMVNDGIVNKFIIDNSCPACYEYLGENSHTNNVCFHYKCEVCGKLVHLHCDEFKELEKHLFSHHQFELNPMKTVFYGICKDCREKQSAEQ